MSDEVEIVKVKAWKDPLRVEWHATPPCWADPFQTMEMIDAELHIPKKHTHSWQIYKERWVCSECDKEVVIEPPPEVDE